MKTKIELNEKNLNDLSKVIENENEKLTVCADSIEKTYSGEWWEDAKEINEEEVIKSINLYLDTLSQIYKKIKFTVFENDKD